MSDSVLELRTSTRSLGLKSYARSVFSLLVLELVDGSEAGLEDVVADGGEIAFV